ncbi:TIGR02444 family protein [Rhodopseudomonas sp. HC1]|uniref:TIGR02444 family protein n=1 Tax=Rhodopseudomonas infernalis TaxID=2897386 RepID=UPI001EE8ADEB|nr:TIGR02444 family protein [Rhodopseudomonas infernalis]MCG6204532.1 TIGR02444 family protein [Rhodopseudomonas infernalis]
MTEPPDLDGPHWTFALDVYGRAGVQPACLRLQDRFGVDINVLLVCLFGGSRLGIAIGEREVALLDEMVAAWRTEIVQPLRTVRRTLKSMPSSIQQPKDLRETVMRAELRAEQVEQAMLADLIRTLPPSPAPDLRAAMHAVTAYYAARCGQVGEDATTEAAIETVLSALSAASDLE